MLVVVADAAETRRREEDGRVAEAGDTRQREGERVAPNQ